MRERILIVDDESNITKSFASLLADEGYATCTAADAEEALETLEANHCDLVVLDLNLPGMSGIELLSRLGGRPSAPPVLVVSGQSDISTALEAVRLGASDYLEKPTPPERLISSVRACLQLARAQRHGLVMADELDQRSRMIGESAAMQELNRTIAQVAPSDATVLISGESGAGKELIATRIHLSSSRRGQPLIKVNCPGIPETLFESELFGHRKGAFTGAVKDYPGKFALADGGTILLDEIGDLPIECQAKLLRALETGVIETLGAVEPRQVDVRVLCATNRDLPKLIEEGKFRQDLYYRITVFLVEAPPLRQRLDDVPLLVGEFLRRFDPGGEMALTPDALAFLTSVDYPGNVRQLKNVVERLSIICAGRTVRLADAQSVQGTATAVKPTDENLLSLSERVRQYESQVIRQTLAEANGNIAEAARRLQVDRANLSRKAKNLER